ncbi:MAG: TlpA disulfide reductase family protein [Bacteroidota bacterium]|nr:TlpA family protein disulfide reductase [Candidatus Kapabacteria bacterium]MDW8220832.1 TlpA disulfide reductase family protein [Bacteroidota bacterium]
MKHLDNRCRISIVVAVTVWGILCQTLVLVAGELKLQPAQPRVGDRIMFIYRPDSLWAQSTAIYAILYRFEENSSEPYADYVRLSRRGDGMWYGELPVMQSDVFYLVRLFNGVRYDDNQGDYWEARVTLDGAKPQRGAWLRQGLSLLGGLPADISRNVDFSRALACMREELKLYPTNLSASVAEIGLSYDLSEISEEEYRQRLQRIVSAPFDTTRENDTRAIIRALNTLGLADKAKALEEDFKKRFPKSKLAEESALQDLQVQTLPGSFVAKVVRYVQNFPDSPNAPIIQAAAMGAFAQTYQLKDAARWLDTLKNQTPIAYNELAKYWCRTDTSQNRGLEYAKKALELAKRLPLYKRPTHISDIEWSLSTSATLGDIYNTIGAIYTELQQPDSAFAMISAGLEATKGDMPAPAYVQLTAYLLERKQFDEAYRMASKGIIATGGDDVLLKWHRRAFDSTLTDKKDTAQYPELLKALRDSAALVKADRQIRQRLDRPMIDGTIFTADRTPVELSSFKGIPTLLVFWASWAEPCIKSMPFLNILYQRYTQSGFARIVVIDAWEEKGKDQFTIVRDYMERNKGLYFKLYVDENNTMARRYGVTGLPMRIYLDKYGRIQYKGSGFTDGLKLVEEIETTLQLLISDRFYQTL